MNKERFIEKMTKRGYEVSETEVVNNGMKRKGLCITKPGCNISPVVYDVSVIPENAIDETIEKLFSNSQPAERLSDSDYVKENLTLCVQKQGMEKIVKRDYLDLELYIRCNLGDNAQGHFSVKVTPDILKRVGLTEDEAFERAKKNTIVDAKVIDVNSMIKELCSDTEENLAEIPYVPELTVVTNNRNIDGAGVIACPEVFDCIGERVVIIPSSIHEVLVYPVSDYEDLDYFNDMVRTVNKNIVSERDVLSDHVYLYENGQITIPEIA